MTRSSSYVVARSRGGLGGRIRVPGDKSISHRAAMLAAIADGTTRITGFLRGEDCLATLDALEALGVPVVPHADGSLAIRGRGLRGLSAPAYPLDFGNAGTAIRLMAGLLAAQPFDSVLTGDASLRSRPMERVAEPLRAMGARVETEGGRAPLRIAGARLRGIDHVLPVASAQIKSALLIAGLHAAGRTTVRSPAPTRDHTERLLLEFGASLAQCDGHTVTLEGPQSLRATDIAVPGDFSSAAFFIVAGCLGAPEGLTIEHVGVNPSRIGLLHALEAMGAHIEVRQRPGAGAGGEPVADVYVEQSELEGIDVPARLVPDAIDELPVLFVAAAAARGRTRVIGAAELRHKESDRIAVMARGLAGLGVSVEETADGLVIEGGGLRGGRVDSHGDHRVAMAFAVAGLASDGPIEVADTTAVATSFPGFLELARAAGLAIEAGPAGGP